MPASRVENSAQGLSWQLKFDNVIWESDLYYSLPGKKAHNKNIDGPGVGDVQKKYFFQWKGINRKQSTRCQHLSWLKASAFFSLQKKLVIMKKQLILGTGTAIWWVTEPH
jgi:hypothetical protein